MDPLDLFTERELYLMASVHDAFKQPYAKSSLFDWLNDQVADGGITVADVLDKFAPGRND